MDTFTKVLVVVQVVNCLLLILFILLHSGRGSGLSDILGGGMGSIASGSSVVERNLDRYTIATTLIFLFTTVVLAIRLQ